MLCPRRSPPIPPRRGAKAKRCDRRGEDLASLFSKTPALPTIVARHRIASKDCSDQSPTPKAHRSCEDLHHMVARHDSTILISIKNEHNKLKVYKSLTRIENALHAVPTFVQKRRHAQIAAKIGSTHCQARCRIEQQRSHRKQRRFLKPLINLRNCAVVRRERLNEHQLHTQCGHNTLMHSGHGLVWPQPTNKRAKLDLKKVLRVCLHA